MNPAGYEPGEHIANTPGSSYPSHSNAQCQAQGGTPPPSFFKRKAKANTAKADTTPVAPPASATLANYDSDGSAFNAHTAKASNTAKADEFIIDSGAP